eukprot:RCo038058
MLSESASSFANTLPLVRVLSMGLLQGPGLVPLSLSAGPAADLSDYADRFVRLLIHCEVLPYPWSNLGVIAPFLPDQLRVQIAAKLSLSLAGMSPFSTALQREDAPMDLEQAASAHSELTEEGLAAMTEGSDTVKASEWGAEDTIRTGPQDYEGGESDFSEAGSEADMAEGSDFDAESEAASVWTEDEAWASDDEHRVAGAEMTAGGGEECEAEEEMLPEPQSGALYTGAQGETSSDEGAADHEEPAAEDPDAPTEAQLSALTALLSGRPSFHQASPSGKAKGRSSRPKALLGDLKAAIEPTLPAVVGPAVRTFKASVGFSNEATAFRQLYASLFYN